MTERAKKEKKLKNANYNVLLVAAATLLNVVMYLTGMNSNFLFSAFTPTLTMGFGDAWSEETGSVVFYALGIAAALLIVAFYAIMFFIGRKKPVTIVPTLVAFTIDTVILLVFVFFLVEKEFMADFILDIAFHIWVMYYCITGTAAYFDLKNLPPEPAEMPVFDGYNQQPADFSGQNQFTPENGDMNKDGQAFEPWQNQSDNNPAPKSDSRNEPYKEPWEN